jgi:hypothetical protein
MGRIEKTVFISYRRTNLPWALAIYQNLTSRGYDVFFDYKSINSGDFEQAILGNIRARAHFVLVLTPSALERCSQPGDWLRREIETALAEKRNIVPLFLEGFDFSDPVIAKQLSGKLMLLKSYNGMNVPADVFDEAMERLHNRYLNIALDAVLHPVSNTMQNFVQKQQSAANEATQVEQRDLVKAEAPELKCVSLGSNSSFVFLFGKNGIWSKNISTDFKDKIDEIHAQGHEFKSVALGPDASYVFLYGKNGAWWSNIPKSLEDKIGEVHAKGKDLKNIALGPNSSYVFLYGKNSAWWSNIPEHLEAKLKELHSEGHEFKSIALGPDSSYVFLYGKNGVWWNNIPEHLESKIGELHADGYVFKHTALGLNSSYIFLYGYNGYWFHNIPKLLKTKLKEVHG